MLAVIDKLNNDPIIHGILVQSPVPGKIDEQAVVDAIRPFNVTWPVVMFLWSFGDLIGAGGAVLIAELLFRQGYLD